jgi:hypothetical protein
MASIIYNAEHVLQSAIAAAFAITDVTPISYTGSIDDARKRMMGEGKRDSTIYVFLDELMPEKVDEELSTPSTTFTPKKLVGAVPIAQLSSHSVPKMIITFLNKYTEGLMTVYLGMLETDEYANLHPFAAFFRLFSSIEFDVRWGNKFIRRAMIRDRHANHLASEIPVFEHKGALFIRFGPYVDRRVALEKKKEDAPESIVVFTDNTGFSNNTDIVMRLVVHGKIPGCLSEAVFTEPVNGASVGSLPLATWATMMKTSKVTMTE